MAADSTARSGRRALLVVLGLLAGCGSGREEAREAAEQQTQMTQDQALWRAQLDVWEDMHLRMKEWHATHPVSSKEEGELDRLRRHEETLAKHRSDAASFRQDLSALDARLRRLSRGTERERRTAQAELWSEHMKLRLAYEGLEAGHQQLVREHAEFVADSAHAAQ